MAAAPLSLAALAIALAIAPVTAHAQRGGGRRQRPSSESGDTTTRRGPARDAPFLEVWLAHKSDIELGDAQVRSLAQMQAQLEEKDRPLQSTLDSLRAIKGGVDPVEMRGRFAAISATMGQLRDNDVATRQAALALLSPTQQQKAEKAEEDARKGQSSGAGLGGEVHGRRPPG